MFKMIFRNYNANDYTFKWKQKEVSSLKGVYKAKKNSIKTWTAQENAIQLWNKMKIRNYRKKFTSLVGTRSDYKASNVVHSQEQEGEEQKKNL